MERIKTSEVMFPLVEQWQQSGQSQKQFSQENNIRYHTFTYWIKRYRQNQYNQNGFIPIDLSGEGGSGIPLGTPRVELLFGNGLTLRIY